MQKLIFISTIHEEYGKCNSNELQKILIRLSPEVVFLEAIKSTYLEIEQLKFLEFGVYHKKLEIKALQPFIHEDYITYVPVLDFGHSDVFDQKYDVVTQYREFQILLDGFNSKASTYGFSFLNSKEAIAHQEELRALEAKLLPNPELNQEFQDHIDAYENNMIKNISAYCKENTFEKAIFMCGVAHRRSMIEKISSNKEMFDLEIEWSFPEDL